MAKYKGIVTGITAEYLHEKLGLPKDCEIVTLVHDQKRDIFDLILRSNSKTEYTEETAEGATPYNFHLN